MNKRILRFVLLTICGVLLTGSCLVDWNYGTEYRYVNNCSTSVSIYHVTTDYPYPLENDTLLVAEIEPGGKSSLFCTSMGDFTDPFTDTDPTPFLAFPTPDGGRFSYLVDEQILVFGNGTEIVHTYDSDGDNVVFTPAEHNICDKDSYVFSEPEKRLRVYTYTFTDADWKDAQ